MSKINFDYLSDIIRRVARSTDPDKQDQLAEELGLEFRHQIELVVKERMAPLCKAMEESTAASLEVLLQALGFLKLPDDDETTQ
jgi:hypothetical protein